ncbi:MAG: PQQ-binding-like beta-propeller repeat protein [Verrucomicrobiota bacterium]
MVFRWWKGARGPQVARIFPTLSKKMTTGCSVVKFANLLAGLLVGWLWFNSPSVIAQDWCGFRGLEKQGYAADAHPPLVWTANQNVRWTTVVPGQGHSSPIAQGSRIYVTTAMYGGFCEKLRQVLDYLTTAAACLLTALGIGLVARLLPVNQHGWQATSAYGQAVFLMLILAVVVETVVFGDNLLRVHDSEGRAWKVTTLMGVACLVLSALHARTSTRWWWIIGWICCAFSVAAYVSLPIREELSPMFSLAGIRWKLILALPILAGVLLFLLAHFVRRLDNPPDTEHATAPVGIPLGGLLWRMTLIAVATFAVITAGVVYGAWVVADRSLENIQWRPVAGWWLIVLAGVLGPTYVFHQARRHARLGQAVLAPPSPLFAGVALTLAGLYFFQANYLSDRRELLRSVVCLDADTGKIQWLCPVSQTAVEKIGMPNSPATPTPVTDPTGVYTYFGSAGLVAMDTQGKIIWKNSQLPSVSQFGSAASPVRHGEHLFLVCDNRSRSDIAGSLPACAAAVDARTGKFLWRTERPLSPRIDTSYATPIVWTNAEGVSLIVQGWDDIKAYSVETGRECWSYAWPFRGMHLVAGMTRNENRLLAMDGEQVLALDLSHGQRTTPAVVWRQKILGEKTASPAVARGMMFLITEEGQATCLDTATGNIHWRHRFPGRYYASVVATDERVYFFSETSRTLVAALDQTFKLLADNRLPDRTYATPAPTGKRLIYRTSGTLYCLEEN